MIAQAGRNFKKPTFLVLLDRLREYWGGRKGLNLREPGSPLLSLHPGKHRGTSESNASPHICLPATPFGKQSESAHEKPTQETEASSVSFSNSY